MKTWWNKIIKNLSKTRKWWWLFVLLIAIFYRFVLIDELPRGMNRDEAAIAYNAWLLAETGKDEWSRVFPIILECFGDNHLPGYPYAVMTLYKFLPVNNLVVRLPSVLAGIGIVILTYLIFKKACGMRVGLLSSFLIAVNPIFIWYSRGAWEANLALFLVLVIFWLGVGNYVDNKKWTVTKLLLILLLLILSFLTYNTPLIIAIILWPFLPWLFKDKGKCFYLPLMGVLLLAIIPCLVILMPVTQKKNNVTIFTEMVTHHQYVDYRQQFSGVGKKLWGNRYVFMGKLLLENTLLSFSPKFWWRGGNHPWHQLPGYNHVTLLTMALIYGSLGKLLFNILKKIKERKNFLMSDELKWLVMLGLTLVPSIITVDAPHATRSLFFFYLLMVIIAVMFFKKINWEKLKVVGIVILGLILCESMVYFYHYHDVLTTKNIYRDGLNELLGEDLRSTLIVSDERQYQYIKLAWELRIPPRLFWQTIIRENPNTAGIIGVSDLANYHFFDEGTESWPNWQVVRFNNDLQIWERKND